jgi:endonuclease/exonuclease/phosphatase family metal-dependent hydrolase
LIPNSRQARYRWTLVTAIAVLLAFSAHGWAQDRAIGGKRDVTIMTLNLYVGADLAPVTTLDPQDPAFLLKLLSGVADIHGKILASDFHARADALARQIVGRGPDIVALQEVSLIRRQHPGDAILGGMVRATKEELDYLTILLDALEDHGGRYEVASQVADSDVEVPMLTGDFPFDDVRITDRDVILVRLDLPPGQLSVSNPKNGNFAAAIPLPFGPSILRGWCSIDVQLRGRSFRFINTHLEDVLPTGLPDFQGMQAAELLFLADNTSLPVVLAGDFNADGNGVYGRSTYELLIRSGLVDAWPVARPLDPGLTWGHDELLADPEAKLSLRLDMLFYRGGSFEPIQAEVIDPLLGRTPPLWMSDHAALFFRLALH